MFVGCAAFDVLLGDIHSLKEKRAVVRPLLAELRNRHPVAVAETGYLDLVRRCEVGVAVVAADAGHCGQVLDAVERAVAGYPPVELLGRRRWLTSSGDQ